MRNPRKAFPRTTRREFLTTTSLALAGSALGATLLRADTPETIPRLLPSDSRRPVEDFLPAPLAPSTLQALATTAVDAARQAGASYADIRVAEHHRLAADIGRVLLFTNGTYGVRAMVDGVWGFSYGRDMTPDAVARCATEAVRAARVAARLTNGASRSQSRRADRESMWNPPPKATGEWHTPMKIDPFAVPVQAHTELASVFSGAVSRVPSIGGFGVTTDWIRETRVVAATTGTLVTQTFHRAIPDIFATVQVRYGASSINVRIPGMRWRSGGYETLAAPELPGQYRAAADEAVRLARYPMRALDVGRHPLVLDGYAMGAILVQLIGPSAELDRVLGFESEASGTSRFTADRLGTPVASTLLTVTGHRAPPSVTAVRWDDEGAEAREHTVIRSGKFVGYHTDISTVSALRERSQHPQQHMHQLATQTNDPAQGVASTLNGCAVAPEAERPVGVRAPHLVMASGATAHTVDDLCRDMKHGVVALNGVYFQTDHQLSSGTIDSLYGLFEVAQGRIVRRVANAAVQFSVSRLLEGLLAVGDETTTRQCDLKMGKGMPWVECRQSATAPAALFREADVIAMRRR
jgi:TldD protein